MTDEDWLEANAAITERRAPTRQQYLESLGRAYLMAPEGSDAEVLLRAAVRSELDIYGEGRLLSALGAGGPIEACADEEPSCYDPEDSTP